MGKQAKKMSLSEAVIIVIISSIASLLGGGLVFLVSWRKAGAEMHKSEGEANSANAEAAKTWAESNQLAAQQNVEIQKE
jgi:formate/nitrite transporter FocA (FNT family)